MSNGLIKLDPTKTERESMVDLIISRVRQANPDMVLELDESELTLLNRTYDEELDVTRATVRVNGTILEGTLEFTYKRVDLDKLEGTLLTGDKDRPIDNFLILTEEGLLSEETKDQIREHLGIDLSTQVRLLNPLPGIMVVEVSAINDDKNDLGNYTTVGSCRIYLNDITYSNTKSLNNIENKTLSELVLPKGKSIIEILISNILKDNPGKYLDTTGIELSYLPVLNDSGNYVLEVQETLGNTTKIHELIYDKIDIGSYYGPIITGTETEPLIITGIEPSLDLTTEDDIPTLLKKHLGIPEEEVFEVTKDIVPVPGNGTVIKYIFTGTDETILFKGQLVICLKAKVSLEQSVTSDVLSGFIYPLKDISILTTQEFIGNFNYVEEEVIDGEEYIPDTVFIDTTDNQPDPGVASGNQDTDVSSDSDLPDINREP